MFNWCISHLQFGLVWFGSVGKIKIANQTMRLSKKMIRIHSNQMRFFAVWVGSIAIFLLD